MKDVLEEADERLKVEGTIKKKKRKRGKMKLKVRLTVRRKDGSLVGRLRFSAASRKAAIARIERRLGRVIEEGMEEEDRGEEDRGEEDRGEEEKGSETGSGSQMGSGTGSETGSVEAAAAEPVARRHWFSIAAGPELIGRHFTYRDDLFEELRQYDLAGAAAVGVTGEAYPVAARRDWLAGLGAAARVSYAPSFRSHAVTGESYPSSAHSYAIGARYRHAAIGLELLAALDLGSQSFSVDNGAEFDSQVPAVAYRYLRPGLGARMPFLDRYSAEAALGYRHVLATGEISSEAYFPRLSARGFDLEAAITVTLLRGMAVRAGGAIEQYGYDLAPQPGDMRVAGGAVDRYPRLFLRVMQ